MKNGTIAEQLRALGASLDQSFASLASDPVLAGAVRRIVDDGDTADPMAEELAARVVAAGQG